MDESFDYINGIIPATETTFVVPASGGGNSAAFTNFIARTSGLDATHTNAYKDLLNGWTSDGLFNSNGTSNFFDAIWIYATQDQTTALLNLVGNTNNATLSGAPTFNVDLGFTASSGNFVQIVSALNGLVHYVQNSAHIGVWAVTAGLGVKSLDVAGDFIFFTHFTDNNAYLRVNDNAGGFADGGGTGFYLGDRQGANARTGYRNGLSIGSYGSVASTVVGANAVTCPADTVSGPQIACCIMGASVDSFQATIYNRLRTYMTAVGVP